MNINSILIYPIKSFGAIDLDTTKAMPKGLEYDRRWMLINSEGKFISQREIPELCLMDCSLDTKGVVVKYLEDETIIPYKQYSEEVVKVSVWSSKFKASIVDHSLSKWFSEKLDTDLRLVKMTSHSKRKKRLFKAPFLSDVSFADGYPILFLGTASMDKLNDQLDEKLNINRFRANVIVDTVQAHEEDEWSNFSIGSAEFLNIKPCARCIMTTIEQESALKGAEPLKTLSTYRKKRNNIYFGTNVITIQEGQFSKGDKIKFG